MGRPQDRKSVRGQSWRAAAGGGVDRAAEQELPFSH
jgi:hypothetical protein